MGHFLDESDRQKLLHLLTNGPSLFLVEAAQALPHRSRAGSDIQGVLGDFRRYARHVQGTREYIGIHVEKVDEHGFLFAVEGGADPQHLAVGAGGVDRDELDGLHGLKSPSATLGVRRLAAKLVKADDEGLGLHKSLGVLDAFNIIYVDSTVMMSLGPGILSLR